MMARSSLATYGTARHDVRSVRWTYIVWPILRLISKITGNKKITRRWLLIHMFELFICYI